MKESKEYRLNVDLKQHLDVNQSQPELYQEKNAVMICVIKVEIVH